MYRFEYSYYRKYKIDNSGFKIVIDSRFDSIEYLELDSLGNIIDNKYYPLLKEMINDISNLLCNDISLLNLNSNYYLVNNDVEQIIYIENEKYNRLIKGNNLLSLDNIFNLFYKLSNIINEEYLLEEEKFNIIR